VGEGGEVCLDVVEELVVGEGVVEVVNNAVDVGASGGPDKTRLSTYQ
jgi:hypothetical protein